MRINSPPSWENRLSVNCILLGTSIYHLDLFLSTWPGSMPSVPTSSHLNRPSFPLLLSCFQLSRTLLERYLQNQIHSSRKPSWKEVSTSTVVRRHPKRFLFRWTIMYAQLILYRVWRMHLPFLKRDCGQNKHQWDDEHSYMGPGNSLSRTQAPRAWFLFHVHLASNKLLYCQKVFLWVQIMLRMKL